MTKKDDKPTAFKKAYKAKSKAGRPLKLNQDVAGLNLALMVLCVCCWGLAEIFDMWVK